MCSCFVQVPVHHTITVVHHDFSGKSCSEHPQPMFAGTCCGPLGLLCLVRRVRTPAARNLLSSPSVLHLLHPITAQTCYKASVQPFEVRCFEFLSLFGPACCVPSCAGLPQRALPGFLQAPHSALRRRTFYNCPHELVASSTLFPLLRFQKALVEASVCRGRTALKEVLET